MGYYAGYPSKKSIVEEVTKSWSPRPGYENRCIAKCWRGGIFSGTLWAVFEHRDWTGNQERWICAFAMDCKGNVRDLGWGYKPVEESMGPYQLSCPLGYLDLAQPMPVFSGYAPEWRDRVREHHAKRKLERQNAA